MMTRIILIHSALTVCLPQVNPWTRMYTHGNWDDFDEEPDIRIRFNEDCLLRTRNFEDLFNMDELRTMTLKTKPVGRPTVTPRRVRNSTLAKRKKPSYFFTGTKNELMLTGGQSGTKKMSQGRPRIVLDENRLRLVAEMRAKMSTDGEDTQLTTETAYVRPSRAGRRKGQRYK